MAAARSVVATAAALLLGCGAEASPYTRAEVEAAFRAAGEPLRVAFDDLEIHGAGQQVTVTAAPVPDVV